MMDDYYANDCQENTPFIDPEERRANSANAGCKYTYEEIEPTE